MCLGQNNTWALQSINSHQLAQIRKKPFPKWHPRGMMYWHFAKYIFSFAITVRVVVRSLPEQPKALSKLNSTLMNAVSSWRILKFVNLCTGTWKFYLWWPCCGAKTSSSKMCLKVKKILLGVQFPAAVVTSAWQIIFKLGQIKTQILLLNKHISTYDPVVYLNMMEQVLVNLMRNIGLPVIDNIKLEDEANLKISLSA